MKFGFNFSVQWLNDPFNYNEEQICKLLSAIGMDCLEIQLAVLGIIDKSGDVNQQRKEEIFNLLKRYKIKVGSIHAPYPYYVPSYLNFKKGHLHHKAIKSLKNSIEVAHELGAKVVVVHPAHTLGFYKSPQEHKKIIVKTIIDNLSIIRDYLEDKRFNIKIGLETMAPIKERLVVGDNPQEIVDIINALDSKKIGVTWDMCHTYRSLSTYKLKIEDFEEMAKYTCHIHYSSFSPILSQCHCPTGYGKEKPIHKMVLLLNGYKGMIINEISPIMLIYLNPKRTMKDWLKMILKQSQEDFAKWIP